MCDPVPCDSVPCDSGPGFGIYVHWPFCDSKCPYCDFNSHVSASIDHRRWHRAYALEIDWAARRIGTTRTDRPVVTSIFFGGGTPSLMPPEMTHGILAAIGAAFPVSGDVEITLEANPSSMEADRFRGFRDAGVNRVSVGVQSLNDGALSFLGRRHSAASARRAIEIAAKTFSRFSFDLIYALPRQTPAEWQNELNAALDYGGDHLSVYQLTIENGTPFFRTGVEPASEDNAATMFHMSNDTLDRAGLPAYETSNHARPGSECRHNMLYWRGGRHVGIGPGAHGRLRGADGLWSSHYRIHDPDRWLDSVDRHGHGTAKSTIIRPGERMEEVIMTGLRLRRGLSRADFALATGMTYEDALDPATLSMLTDGGFLILDDAGLRATPAGWPRLNAVIARLLA